MSDKSRYKKLAAAKKKLKEYNQSKEKLTEQGLPSSSVDNGLSQLNISSGGMKSSSLSGLLDLTEEIKALNGENNVKELLPNGSNLLLTGNKAQSNEQIKDVREFFSQQKETPFLESCAVTASATTKESPTVNSIENDNQKKPEHQSASNAIPVDPIKMDAINRNVSNHSASTAKMDNTVEILISERATLNAKLSELQTSCKEKDLEIEELNIRLDGALKRLDSFERLSLEQKEENNNLKTKLNELKTEVFLKDDELKKSKLQSTDNSEYIEELKRELKLQREKMQSFGEELKNKETQIDILNIRLQQVSDESSVAIDNRVEDLTQTKFQYEKRIQDLQEHQGPMDLQGEQLDEITIELQPIQTRESSAQTCTSSRFPLAIEATQTHDSTTVMLLKHSLNSLKTHQPVPDQYQIFGDYVASEMRNLTSVASRKALKRDIQRLLLNIDEEQVMLDSAKN